MIEPNGETPSEAIPVLIAGGSLVGLSAAMFLAARGVPCLVVERHRGSALHPRARGFTQRTLEMFDTAGLRGLPEIPASFGGPRRVRAESMVSAPKEEVAWTPEGTLRPSSAPASSYSPHSGGAIAQDHLEPLLRQRALELGAVLCPGTELVRFEDRPDGVTAWLTDSQGAVRTVRASYLIGCDGNRSLVREALGIGRQGVGALQVMRSVLFRAEDLEQYRRGIGQWEIEQPGLEAFLAGYGDGRWVLMFRDDLERGDAALKVAIERAIGLPVPVEIITTGRWELTALISDRFRKGRVFLAGDAAHTLPPTRGGYGANTGIADAFNLAWKLAAVLSGQSKESLLDSYDQERRPVAWMRLQQTFGRPDYARHSDAYRNIPLIDPIAIELGELCRSDVIALDGDGAALPPARLPDEWQGQPGTRAPHRIVTRGGKSISTLELYGAGWVLLSSSPAWCKVASRMRERTGIPVTAIDLRSELGPGEGALLGEDLGIGERGASLMRPDGVIAWRSAGEDATLSALERAMARVAQPVA